MIKKYLAVASIALGLTACSSANQNFVAGDLNTAAMVANSPNAPSVPVSANAVDPSGYQCWGTLAPSVAALGTAQSVGFATLIEIARVAIIQSRTKGACAALAAPILSQISLLPGAGNAIAIAATSVQ
jgi:hypothetical protein